MLSRDFTEKDHGFKHFFHNTPVVEHWQEQEIIKEGRMYDLITNEEGECALITGHFDERMDT